MPILVNLLSNATQALDQPCNDRNEKRLKIRVAMRGGTVQIMIIDNGTGIAPENLTRIFQHGFTTKKDGHGFGLHSGALAAREMGGKLIAESDGIGCGAVFTLELPLSHPNQTTS
jgi:C4-dicarboxylate-specific signal transduction histidine kinase